MRRTNTPETDSTFTYSETLNIRMRAAAFSYVVPLISHIKDKQETIFDGI